MVQTGFFLSCYLPLLLALSGDKRWLNGWVSWSVLLVFLALHPILLVPINPKLLAERERGTQAEGTKDWDKILTLIGPGLMPFTSQFLAAFDHRFAWSSVPIIIQIVSTILTIGGYGVFLWAMVSNGFFTEGVRIQTERGHIVCDRGPYQIVRHPGYMGSIIAILATPLMMNSIWGLIPAVIGAVVIVIRAVLEDETLKVELDGYAEYAQRVHCRLIPGIF